MREMAGDRADAVFGTLIRVLELAASEESQWRGYLWTKHKKPATPAQIARMIGFPEENVTYALEILTHEDVGYLELVPYEEVQRGLTDIGEQADIPGVSGKAPESPDSAKRNGHAKGVLKIACRGDRSHWTLTLEQLLKFAEQYPEMDVYHEARKARRWSQDIPPTQVPKKRWAYEEVLERFRYWLDKERKSPGEVKKKDVWDWDNRWGAWRKLCPDWDKDRLLATVSTDTEKAKRKERNTKDLEKAQEDKGRHASKRRRSAPVKIGPLAKAELEAASGRGKRKLTY